MKIAALLLLSTAACAAPTAIATPAAGAPDPRTAREADAVLADARTLYVDLHQHPELSGRETESAAKVAGALRALGYEVTEKVGGTGVVALLKNGAGPTVMMRTELDALPVEEKTGVPYASTTHTKDASGADVPVMHACGHDLHMASLVGAAGVLAKTKRDWHGTLMLVAQPAEETLAGGESMLKDGLFSRFSRPDVALAFHVTNANPAGSVALSGGVQSTSSDALRVRLFGKGGHGAMPHTTVDPVVLAARTVLALQTIVSREVKPGEVAVVTVGTMRAGTKNNIISDEAELGLSIRTFKPEVRKQVLEALARIVKAEAAAAGSPREPLIETQGRTDPVVNDAALTERSRGALAAALGKEHVTEAEPMTVSEDFSYFTREGVPGVYVRLGGAEPKKWADAKASGALLPSNHSPFFAPDVEPALRTGIVAEVAVMRAFLAMSAAQIHDAVKVAAAKPVAR